VDGKEPTNDELEQLKKTFSQVLVPQGKKGNDEGKMTAIIGFLKNSIGVKDISSL
jgi:hypothetical protein